ncbi:hypothetical protein [Winogradskyella jejuensis]|uniref:Uncharacterized protein n=1 Tax=Winogradskyella jejuensis TaxID=1089305 RepID=A0A1M5TEN6_9FLAO|nr:hypothetical protein [Winogradskyella jejuensis]SHH49182.1 hypothetical protein SAMN05444148_2143 [Winogradskyella jejuensis]
MNLSKLINIICIILGGVIAIYAQAEAQQNTYILIGGIVLLMFGIYRISRNVPSKFDKAEEESFVKTERDTSTSLSDQISKDKKVE